MKTYSQKASEIKREWWVIDAASLPLGKLAVVIADKLMGKSKVTYTPHIDNGDYVVVTNAKKLVVTGDKMVQKKYYRHSGYPGGIKECQDSNRTGSCSNFRARNHSPYQLSAGQILAECRSLEVDFS